MKRFLALLTVWLAAISSGMGQPKGVVSLHYPDYMLSVMSTLAGVPDADVGPFIIGKVDGLPKKEAKSRFGILYGDQAKSLGSEAALEIWDAASNRLLKRITLEEFFGKEDATWKHMPAESRSNGSFNVAAYEIRTKELTATFVRDIRVVEDTNLPTGKGIAISFSLKSNTPKKVKARFFGTAVGALAIGENSFSIISTEPAASVTPAMAVYVQPAVRIQSGVLRKNKPQGFTVSTGEIDLEANTSATLMSFSVAGTTIRFGNNAKKQADNLVAYFATKKPVPNMVAITVPSSQTFHPGDTIAYTIYDHNIGTAPAVEVSISNPIPQGTRYVEGSALGEGTTISFTRTPVSPPQQGQVTAINWIFKEMINQGEERWVQFKVVVQ